MIHLHGKRWSLCSNLDVCPLDSPANQKTNYLIRNKSIENIKSVSMNQVKLLNHLRVSMNLEDGLVVN